VFTQKTDKCGGVRPPPVPWNPGGPTPHLSSYLNVYRAPTAKILSRAAMNASEL
jgi:hypothetical protein